jgi:hypothetical protein
MFTSRLARKLTSNKLLSQQEDSANTPSLFKHGFEVESIESK